MKDRCIHAVSVTDASGAAIQHLEIDRREIREPPLKLQQGREQYMAFGEVFVDQRRTGFGTPYKFNAKELDCESGYYYYSARYYDPRMARFLSVDPLAGEFPSWTSYHYVHNNPLRYIDPTEMRAEERDDWVYGASRGIYWDENATSQSTTKEGEVYLGDGFATVSDNGLQTNYNSDKSFDHNSTDDGNLPTVTVTGYRNSKMAIASGAAGVGIGFKNEVLKTLELGETGSKYLKYSKGLGVIGGILSGGYTGYNTINYYNNGGNDWRVLAKAGLDLTMTGVGFVGTVGVFISASYFVTDAATDGFGGFGQPTRLNTGQ